MSTLHTICTNILTVAKVTPDTAMYSNKLITAANLFVSSFSKRIKDTLSKGHPGTNLTLSYEVELVEDITIGRLISLNPVYQTINIAHYGNSPFKAVRSSDGIQVFMYVRESMFNYMFLENLVNNIPTYTIKNNHIIIGNKELIASVTIEAAFSEPYLINFGNEEVRNLEDGEMLLHEFPCPPDMLNSITFEVAQMIAGGQAPQQSQQQ